MGASEDRANVRSELRESALRWLIDLLTSAPEPSDGSPEEMVLYELRSELDDGATNYNLSVKADEETFQSMPPAQIAEQLLYELADVASVIRRERRILSQADPRPNYAVTGEGGDEWGFVIGTGKHAATGGPYPDETSAVAAAEQLVRGWGLEPVRQVVEETVEVPIDLEFSETS